MYQGWVSSTCRCSNTRGGRIRVSLFTSNMGTPIHLLVVDVETGGLDSRSLINKMTALHGIAQDPKLLQAVATDLEVSRRKLEEVTQDTLRDVEPAFIKPTRLPPRRQR